MGTFRLFLISLFITSFSFNLQARETQYKTAWEASLQGLASLKLDTISASNDSLAVRLIVADSVSGKIEVFELRLDKDKTVSVIYWAEAEEQVTKRLFGLISPKVRYSPHFQVGLLSPYQKVTDIISNLPSTELNQISVLNHLCTSSYIKIDKGYFQSSCCEGDCSFEDELQAFFDKYFFYEKE